MNRSDAQRLRDEVQHEFEGEAGIVGTALSMRDYEWQVIVMISSSHGMSSKLDELVRLRPRDVRVKAIQNPKPELT